MTTSRTAALEAARKLGRELRYEVLPGFLGCEVLILDPLAAASATAYEAQRFLGCDVVFDGPDLEKHQIAAVRSGLLDLTFRVPRLSLDAVRLGGFRALRELGLSEPDPVNMDEGSGTQAEGLGSTVLDMMVEEIERELVYLRVFLRDPDFTLSSERLRWSRSGVPDGFWPRTFVVEDVCLTNAPMLWFAKHFYL